MPTNPIIYEHRRIIKPIILTGITSGEPNPNIIQGFIEDFKPDYYYEIDVEGYTPTFIEYYAWDEDEDGPIPGIKTSTYTLNENIANTNPIIPISQWKPNFEYLAKILKDDAIDSKRTRRNK